MGRLAGFRYREIVKRLKQLGFEFDRQAAGSHEIWHHPVLFLALPEADMMMKDLKLLKFLTLKLLKFVNR